MKLTIRGLILTVVAAIIGVSLYMYSYTQTKKYFQDNLDMSRNLLMLQLNINKLRLEILKSSFSLHYNYDEINHSIDKTKKLFEEIDKTLSKLNSNHRKSFVAMKALEDDFELYIRRVQKYLTINSSLKNSLLNIPEIQVRASKSFKDQSETLMFFSKVYSDVFIAKNAMDDNFLTNIRERISYIDRIKNRYRESKERYGYLESLRLHLIKFVEIFPVYKNLIRDLLDNSLDDKVVENIQIFQRDSHIEIDDMNNNSSALLVLYIFSLIVISLFVHRVDIENQNLKNLKDRLEKHLMRDSLTSLGNMKAFNIDLQNFRHPSLILININKFKHINEFYGTEIGDIALINTSQKIINITPNNFKVYRLGGDDFGVLFENSEKNIGLERYIKDLYIAGLENYCFQINNMWIELRFSIGASSSKNRLFETADMALKLAKNLARTNYVIYTPKIDKTLEIKANIETISNISMALKENRLKAYYQPIYNIKTKRIEKYEALARIELENGSLLKPFDFMSSAIEAKLSGEITISILEQIIEVAKTNDYEFSINISSGDIEFYKDREEIIDILKNNIEVAHQIIFELLESEDIYNYKAINEFIKEVKRLGCKIAIDDFGSGYSNFEKVLNLDIDILKVDGSLIQNIDKDEHSRLITKTILRFAKYANLRTIAEFVYSESIYCHIKKLNFDYAQGFYVGKPSPKL
jgi:diguanylate cyclase (GGDEF)-like protein